MTETVSISCPIPPSVNRIWRNVRGRTKPHLDRRYETWRRVFDNIIMATRPRPKVSGHFIAIITLSDKKRRSNADADNRAKALMDALQRCEIIENDSLADSVTIRWGYAPEGCMVTLRAVEEVSPRQEAAA